MCCGDKLIAITADFHAHLNRAKSIACSHRDALFGHLANQQAVHDQALVETACNISSFGTCSDLQSW